MDALISSSPQSCQIFNNLRNECQVNSITDHNKLFTISRKWTEKKTGSPLRCYRCSGKCITQKNLSTRRLDESPKLNRTNPILDKMNLFHFGYVFVFYKYMNFISIELVWSLEFELFNDDTSARLRICPLSESIERILRNLCIL